MSEKVGRQRCEKGETERGEEGEMVGGGGREKVGERQSKYVY